LRAGATAKVAAGPVERGRSWLPKVSLVELVGPGEWERQTCVHRSCSRSAVYAQ